MSKNKEEFTFLLVKLLLDNIIGDAVWLSIKNDLWCSRRTPTFFLIIDFHRLKSLSSNSILKYPLRLEEQLGHSLKKVTSAVFDFLRKMDVQERIEK